MNKIAQVKPLFEKQLSLSRLERKHSSKSILFRRRFLPRSRRRFFPSNGCWSGIRARSRKRATTSLVSGRLPIRDKESLIVIRDKIGKIHGFFNVCRHRGTRLCEDGNGHLSAIQCPYHAWTYGLDGRLIGAPHMDEVPGFDKADYSLHPVNLALWEGFIFVNLAKAPMPLGEMVRAVGGEVFALEHVDLAPGKTDRVRRAGQLEADVRELFGVLSLPGRASELQRVSPYDSAENDLSEGPFLGGFMSINKGAGLTMSGNACALPIEHEHEHEQKARVFYYSIFPNMLLSLHPEYVMVHQLWPQSPERTLIVCDWFFHPDASERDDFNPEDAIEFWDMTNKQDWHVCELSQQGIASRAYEPGPYSSREVFRRRGTNIICGRFASAV